MHGGRTRLATDEQHFIGFANYVRLFHDELIRMAFWHNVFFLITVPLITIALALFFAFLLNVGGRGNRAGIRGVWGSSVYKIIFFFPQVLSLVLIGIHNAWDTVTYLAMGERNGQNASQNTEK
jgi:N-acetylglucosamine transport system permease protein